MSLPANLLPLRVVSSLRLPLSLSFFPSLSTFSSFSFSPLSLSLPPLSSSSLFSMSQFPSHSFSTSPSTSSSSLSSSSSPSSPSPSDPKLILSDLQHAANSFLDYNFRVTFQRKVQEQFGHFSSSSSPATSDIEKSLVMLETLKRQSAVQNLYYKTPHIIERNQQKQQREKESHK